MLGRNILELNEATMIEVIQYWLTNKVLNKDEPSPHVKSVRATSQMGSNTFYVEMDSEA